MKYFINILIILLVISCKTADKDSGSTYFGGEIINPKDNFVLFLKDDKIIDTLKLDKNNRFLKKFKSLKEGLYTFKQGAEFQYVYLEPSDSILVRLNTWDFDESLVFSGKGSNKNEFLINLFLQNEKEEKAMYNYFNLDEVAFQRKIDSLSQERVALYNYYVASENTVSSGLKKIINTTINFPLYKLKEIYPYYFKKIHSTDSYPIVSSSFYNYRNKINLNDENLVTFYPYQNYIVSYLYNLNYQLQEKDSTKNNSTINILNATIEHITVEDFKNSLLKKIIINDFLKNEPTCGINENALTIFYKNCTNQEYITQVKNLVHDSKAIKNNEPLVDFEIESYNNDKSKISDIIKNKNSVIYFWSTEFMTTDYLVNRIKFLEKRYPKVQFIGINMQTASNDFLNDPYLKLLDLNMQFSLPKDSQAYNCLTSKYPRIITIDKEGIVKNGFTYLGSPKLNSELIKLQIN